MVVQTMVALLEEHSHSHLGLLGAPWICLSAILGLSVRSTDPAPQNQKYPSSHSDPGLGSVEG